MEFPYALKLMEEEKECEMRKKMRLCFYCADCPLNHHDEDMIEAYQQAIFALKELIKRDEQARFAVEQQMIKNEEKETWA